MRRATARDVSITGQAPDAATESGARHPPRGEGRAVASWGNTVNGRWQRAERNEERRRAFGYGSGGSEEGKQLRQSAAQFNPSANLAIAVSGEREGYAVGESSVNRDGAAEARNRSGNAALPEGNVNTATLLFVNSGAGREEAAGWRSPFQPQREG